MIKHDNKDKWSVRREKFHWSFWRKHGLQTCGFHAESGSSRPLCVYLQVWEGKKKNSQHLKMLIPFLSPPPTNNFLCPGCSNSDACHVDFSFCIPLRLSASLCSSSCSMSTFHRRPGRVLSCYRSETRCRVFDRYQPEQDAKKKKKPHKKPTKNLSIVQTHPAKVS